MRPVSLSSSRTRFEEEHDAISGRRGCPPHSMRARTREGRRSGRVEAMIISVFGIAGRWAGDLLTSALGWASSLLFGRVPRSHQVFLVLMMALSILWSLSVLGVLVPSVQSLFLAGTPHPPFVNLVWLAFVLLVGVAILPLGVGLAGYLVPASGERQGGAGVPREIARGYLLAPVISGLLVFLAAVGIARKIRSKRHGWADVHVPIVVKPDGYDTMVRDLNAALDSAGLSVVAEEAPWVLTLPARVLTAVAGGNVQKLRPDRLMTLNGRDLRVGVYPSDIAISGATRERTRARAALLSRLATTAAHLTTSEEAQKVEDRLAKLGDSSRTSGGKLPAADRAEFDAIDEALLDLAVPTDEWDILYRLRLQIERDLLVGAEPGTEFPGQVLGTPDEARPGIADAPYTSQDPYRSTPAGPAPQAGPGVAVKIGEAR